MLEDGTIPGVRPTGRFAVVLELDAAHFRGDDALALVGKRIGQHVDVDVGRLLKFLACQPQFAIRPIRHPVTDDPQVADIGEVVCSRATDGTEHVGGGLLHAIIGQGNAAPVAIHAEVEVHSG